MNGARRTCHWSPSANDARSHSARDGFCISGQLAASLVQFVILWKRVASATSMRKLCRNSGKVKFMTADRAWKRAGEISSLNAKKSDGITKPLGFDVYRCRHCNHFHLTSIKETPIQAAARVTQLLQKVMKPSQKLPRAGTDGSSISESRLSLPKSVRSSGTSAILDPTTQCDNPR